MNPQRPMATFPLAQLSRVHTPKLRGCSGTLACECALRAHSWARGAGGDPELTEEGPPPIGEARPHRTYPNRHQPPRQGRSQPRHHAEPLQPRVTQLREG